MNHVTQYITQASKFKHYLTRATKLHIAAFIPRGTDGTPTAPRKIRNALQIYEYVNACLCPLIGRPKCSPLLKALF
jgi:hypothetical protein